MVLRESRRVGRELVNRILRTRPLELRDSRRLREWRIHSRDMDILTAIRLELIQVCRTDILLP
jgi:hypothetical protein